MFPCIPLLTGFPGFNPRCAVSTKVTPAACSDISQPFWLRGARALQSQPFWGLGSCQQRAHLARRACLGSCPCLHGEPELMVLKWRPDGDRGLIAAEAAPASPPAPAVRLLLLEPRPSATSIIQHSLLLSHPLYPHTPPQSRCRPDRLLLGRPSLALSRVISAIVSFPLFILSPPLPSAPPPLPPSLPPSLRLAPFAPAD